MKLLLLAQGPTISAKPLSSSSHLFDMAALSETILLIGGPNGKFARTLLDVHQESLICPVRSELDLTMSATHLRRFIRDVRPAAIGIVGSFTNVSLAYDQPDACMAANYYGPKTILEAAHEIGAFVAVVSTAMVFCGQTSNIAEHLPRASKPPRAGPYSESKFRLELAMSPQDAILRIHCPIDEAYPNPVSPNFLNKLLALVYADKVVTAYPISHTITSFRDAAELFDFLLRSKLPGIYHSGSTDLISPGKALASALTLFNFDRTFIGDHIHIDHHLPQDSNRYPKRLGLGLARTYQKIRNTPLKPATALIYESFQHGTLLSP